MLRMRRRYKLMYNYIAWTPMATNLGRTTSIPILLNLSMSWGVNLSGLSEIRPILPPPSLVSYISCSEKREIIMELTHNIIFVPFFTKHSRPIPYECEYTCWWAFFVQSCLFRGSQNSLTSLNIVSISVDPSRTVLVKHSPSIRSPEPQL